MCLLSSFLHLPVFVSGLHPAHARFLAMPRSLSAPPTSQLLAPCLQAFAGIVTVSVGHCHPAVTAAIAEQSARLQHTTTIYLNDQVALYAKELTDRMPGNLKVAYFVNSGSEANDSEFCFLFFYIRFVRL